MGISKRLKFIAETVTPGMITADIGTDHGYVPVYLLRKGISPRVIAADMSAASLEKARAHAEYFHLQDEMECRLSDGFSAFEAKEVECAVISGMGGILMVRILSEYPQVTASLKEVVLSPHRDADLVRNFLLDQGFKIVSDQIIEDKGKNYPVIKAVPEK